MDEGPDPDRLRPLGAHNDLTHPGGRVAPARGPRAGGLTRARALRWALVAAAGLALAWILSR